MQRGQTLEQASDGALSYAEQPAQLLISMNRCCEKAVPLGKATCPDCEEASAGYQAAMTSTETPPWE